MSGWELPESAVVNGREYQIRSDFRAVLDVFSILSDAEIDDRERGFLALTVFYPEFDEMGGDDYQEAIAYMHWFIGGGEEPDDEPRPKLIDWEQDFPLIVNPVNRVLGYESRAAEHLHWWSFLSAYYEIGDCFFAQVVSLRKKLKQGKRLDKSDKEFYRKNRKVIELRGNDEVDEEALAEWIV